MAFENRFIPGCACCFKCERVNYVALQQPYVCCDVCRTGAFSYATVVTLPVSTLCREFVTGFESVYFVVPLFYGTDDFYAIKTGCVFFSGPVLAEYGSAGFAKLIPGTPTTGYYFWRLEIIADNIRVTLKYLPTLPMGGDDYLTGVDAFASAGYSSPVYLLDPADTFDCVSDHWLLLQDSSSYPPELKPKRRVCLRASGMQSFRAGSSCIEGRVTWTTEGNLTLPNCDYSIEAYSQSSGQIYVSYSELGNSPYYADYGALIYSNNRFGVVFAATINGSAYAAFYEFPLGTYLPSDILDSCDVGDTRTATLTNVNLSHDGRGGPAAVGGCEAPPFPATLEFTAESSCRQMPRFKRLPCPAGTDVTAEFCLNAYCADMPVCWEVSITIAATSLNDPAQPTWTHFSRDFTVNAVLFTIGSKSVRILCDGSNWPGYYSESTESASGIVSLGGLSSHQYLIAAEYSNTNNYYYNYGNYPIGSLSADSTIEVRCYNYYNAVEYWRLQTSQAGIVYISSITHRCYDQRFSMSVGFVSQTYYNTPYYTGPSAAAQYLSEPYDCEDSIDFNLISGNQAVFPATLSMSKRSSCSCKSYTGNFSGLSEDVYGSLTYYSLSCSGLQCTFVPCAPSSSVSHVKIRANQNIPLTFSVTETLGSSPYNSEIGQYCRVEAGYGPTAAYPTNPLVMFNTDVARFTSFVYPKSKSRNTVSFSLQLIDTVPVCSYYTNPGGYVLTDTTWTDGAVRSAQMNLQYTCTDFDPDSGGTFFADPYVSIAPFQYLDCSVLNSVTPPPIVLSAV